MEETKCPFCGNNVEVNAEKCPSCGALFKEPDLPNIKFKEFRVFLALDVLTFGFFASLWFFINYRAINFLTKTDKDALKFKWLVVLLLISLLVYVFYFGTNEILSFFFGILQYGILIGLTYRVLRIIQKYTAQKYDVTLDFNPYYVFFFSVLYLVHFIDTYTDRVDNSHEYFDFRSPQGMTLIILLIIFALIINFKPYFGF